MIVGVFHAVLLSGCANSPGTSFSNLTERGRLLNQGPPARLTATSIAAHRENYVPLLYEFAVQARQVRPEDLQAATLDAQQSALLKVVEWRAVVLVGQGYIDTECGNFLSALNELERQKRATLANLNAIQSATIGIMGLAVAAQKAIGIVGVSFGLVASLFDNTTSSVLYQLPASSIRSIVTSQRDVLRQDETGPLGPLTRITNQGLAAARIAEYVQYCTPITIEANVSKVLNSARLQAGTNNIETTPTSSAITSALAPVITAIPRDAGRVFVQPTGQNTIPGPVAPDVQKRVLAMINTIRAINVRFTLDQLAAALELQNTEDAGLVLLRDRIRVEIVSRVNGAGPARAKQQMDQLSSVLGPILGSSF